MSDLARLIDAQAMAQLLAPQAPRPRELDTRSQATPVVVCPFELPRAGRYAVAVAASLSRALGGQLALIPAGSPQFDPASFAAAAAAEGAELIVLSASPAQARALAALTACPVILVPALGPAPRPLDAGPLVCALDRTASSGHVAWAATRFALQLGATLRLIHIGAHTSAADVPGIVRAIGATLLVLSADDQGPTAELILEAAHLPVMLIPVDVELGTPVRPDDHA